MVEGNIMAIIMASHIRVNMAAEANAFDIPVDILGIHIMLIVQPPGMGMPPDISPLDMERLK